MISIIVPCYNSCKYLKKALNSLINQTSNEFNVIFVDDGSEDDTIGYINKCLKNTNVQYKIFSIDHTGVGAARNLGVKVCTTPYIMFLDSDDYLKENTIELCVSEIRKKNVDIIIGEYEHESNGKIVWTYKDSYSIIDKNIDKNEILAMIFDNKVHISASSVIYKSELFKGIRFDEKCLFHEDLNVWYKLINKAESFSFINLVIAVYVIRSESISHDLNKEKLQQGIFMLNDLIEEFTNEKVPLNIIDKIKRKTIPNICYLFFNELSIRENDLIKFYNEKNYMNILKKAKIENTSISAFIKFFRIKLIAYFPNIYVYIWKIYKLKVKPFLRR